MSGHDLSFHHSPWSTCGQSDVGRSHVASPHARRTAVTSGVRKVPGWKTPQQSGQVLDALFMVHCRIIRVSVSFRGARQDTHKQDTAVDVAPSPQAVDLATAHSILGVKGTFESPSCFDLHCVDRIRYTSASEGYICAESAPYECMLACCC